MGVELFRLIANRAGPISMQSPRSLCYKGSGRCAAVSSNDANWPFLFLTSV